MRPIEETLRYTFLPALFRGGGRMTPTSGKFYSVSLSMVDQAYRTPVHQWRVQTSLPMQRMGNWQDLS